MNPLFRQPMRLWLAHNLVTIGDIIDIFATVHRLTVTGLEITAGQRTMSGLIVDLTGQTIVLPVMLTSQNEINLRFLLFSCFSCYLSGCCVLRNFDMKSW